LPRATAHRGFCGPGNNGGDGFVAARCSAPGFAIDLGLLGTREGLRGDAALAARSWTGAVHAIKDVDLDAADLAIDALFGAGLAALSMDRPKLRFCDSMHGAANQKAILAVDVLRHRRLQRQIRGAAIKATRTITFFRRKPGHYCCPAAPLRQHVARISELMRASSRESRPNLRQWSGLWRESFQFPRIDGHKYSRGHACRLRRLAQTGRRDSPHAAPARRRRLVTIATPREALCAHAAALTAIMTRVCDDPDAHWSAADRRKNALVMGRGSALEKTKALVRPRSPPMPRPPSAPCHRPRPDALTSFEDMCAVSRG